MTVYNDAYRSVAQEIPWVCLYSPFYYAEHGNCKLLKRRAFSSWENAKENDTSKSIKVSMLVTSKIRIFQLSLFIYVLTCLLC